MSAISKFGRRYDREFKEKAGARCYKERDSAIKTITVS